MKMKYSLIILILLVFAVSTGCDGKVAEKNEIIYYGEWITTNNVYYAPISAMTKEQYDDEYLGKVASYSKDKAVFKDVIKNTPIYKESTMDNVEFRETYRVNLDDLGIEGDVVEIVEIQDWINPCSLLIVKDSDTMISLWDGLFFELKRK